ncbi:MAG: heterodisulfide reductase-related iron-sulfur binding cluster [Desulfatiglandaceae bacterium]
MHSLIDWPMVDTIRATGKTSEDLPERIPILEEHHLPYDQPAENVVVSGCQILPGMPHLLDPLARIFNKKGLSYTFLSREYCCGNYLYRPAIKEKNDAAMAECRELSREFVGMNVKQARELGARRIIIFCSPCYPIYKYAFPEENIVFYPAALNELMEPIRCDEKVDYYAGCYRLHRKFSPVPMDLGSTNDILDKLKGLEVHRINAPKCCFHPEGLSHMITGVRTQTMLHICTGCYGQALQNMPRERGVEVLMLPDFVERAMER